jgi:heat shock protein HslJ
MARMLRFSALTGALLVAATLAIAGCATNAGPGAAPDPIGTWGAPSESTEPSIVLAADGTLTGTDGCNRLTGAWSMDGTTVTFEHVATTRMFCEGVDTWLSELAAATIADETMTVLDESGAEIGTLPRTE